MCCTRDLRKHVLLEEKSSDDEECAVNAGKKIRFSSNVADVKRGFRFNEVKPKDGCMID
jgi:hypothetical protein